LPAARGAVLEVMDVMAPCVPTGPGGGRIGNFINGELWGRAGRPSLPWAMVFPQSGSMHGAAPVADLPVPAGRPAAVRAAVAGMRAQAAATGQVSAPFLIGYGVLRFVAEYFREPDSFLGLLALGMSMGQWLCLPMIAAGAGAVGLVRPPAAAAGLRRIA
jgi:phosphatidylglycerol:prolipoprotein diacylglycerol transferase